MINVHGAYLLGIFIGSILFSVYHDNAAYAIGSIATLAAILIVKE